ncbi:RDD family protein [Pedobacter sp. AW31-3R]|uniref:RDD family protein n=1 Tax=Pedobacter sp. AW31-3R TaxID=3445781 RepID=UPI003F9EE178
MEKNESYTVVIEGKPQGPYDLDGLKELSIVPGTFIRKPGMEDYKEAHEFPELRALFGFSFEQTAPQYFASFDQRLLAWAIDYFLLLLIYIFFILLSFIFVEDRAERLTMSLTFLPLLPVAKFMYGSLAESSAHQGTIGKRLLKIKVGDQLGRRISPGRSFGRNTAKILSALPLCFGYLYSFLNKKQQTWHDIAANTLVVKERLI